MCDIKKLAQDLDRLYTNYIKDLPSVDEKLIALYKFFKKNNYPLEHASILTNKILSLQGLNFTHYEYSIGIGLFFGIVIGLFLDILFNLIFSGEQDVAPLLVMRGLGLITYIIIGIRFYVGDLIKRRKRREYDKLDDLISDIIIDIKFGKGFE